MDEGSETPAGPTPAASRARDLGIALALAGLTVAVFAGVRGHGFITLDDTAYIANNVRVREGLTWRSLAYVFTTTEGNHWAPLTGLSVLADVALFGMDAGRHHLVNLGIHVVNTLLLFLLLRKMTGAPWRSGFVAALFAVHPLHVEPVAWACGRVDTLSGFFWMATTGAYLRWVDRPGAGRYAAVVVLFAAGLMCKPMLVTLPLVLLLLDGWPLGRLGPPGGGDAERKVRTSSLAAAVREKIPLFLVAAGFAILALSVRGVGGGTGAPAAVPAGVRAANAALSAAAYLRKAVWPSSLAVFYPHPWDVDGSLPFPEVAVAVLVLAALSYLAFRHRRRAPWLAVGWLWYVVTLAPVTGVVDFAGLQAMADRYTYIPLVGVFIMAAWGVPRALEGRRHRDAMLAVAAGLALLAYSAAAWVQVSRWRDTETLFSHALRVTRKNYVAHANLGVALFNKGRTDDAIAHYLEAIRIFPAYEDAYVDLGILLLQQRRIDEAISWLGEALRLNPDAADARQYFGTALGMRGDVDGAIANLRVAVGRNPDSAAASYNLATLLDGQGKLEEAVSFYRNALRTRPDHAKTRNNLGFALLRMGRTGEAILQLREAVALSPQDDVARRNLERALSSR